MLDINRYLRNPFGSPKISRSELMAFTADHLGRLVSQNADGSFNEELAATEGLFAELEGRLSDEATATAVRQARTAATNEKRDAIMGALSRMEALIHARFPRGSATYIELLPGRLGAFESAPLDRFGPELEALIERLTPYSATIGEADVAALTALQAEWSALRGDHISRKAGSATAAAERRDTTDNLRDQLFTNLLVIARRHQGDPDRLALYMTQSLLEDPTATPAEPVPG